jgi:hypothetical protein
MMKNITKRGVSFRVRVYHDGRYKTETFDTLIMAQIWRDTIKAGNASDPVVKAKLYNQVWELENKSFSLKDALERYAVEFSPLKKSALAEISHIDKIKNSHLCLKSFFLFSDDDMNVLLTAISRSESAKRKNMCLISHLYKMAKSHWKMQVKNPVEIMRNSPTVLEMSPQGGVLNVLSIYK